jgi:hypothetical protein
MTSLPQTHQRTLPAQDGRRRTSPAATPSDTSSSVRGRARETLPTVDPSMAFGCVDWFLYPDPAVGHSAAEAQAQGARA